MKNKADSLRKKISRMLIPRSWVEVALKKLTNRLIKQYQKKYPWLIVRKSTSDHYVFRDIFLLHEFQLPVEVKPKLIVDLGAYIGLSALYYAETYPDAKIICVEPEDSNFELLRSNTERLRQVELINAGVWSKNAGLRIKNKEVEKWAFSLEEVPEGEEYDVFAVTIDSILAKSGCDRIDILKIDVEGAEKQLFSEGFEKWIDKVDVIVVELHDRIIEGCSKAVYNAIGETDWAEYKKGEKVIFVRKLLIK
ncbi:FkbM family methyltransferase [Crocinitomicaceae bacterium CZZ-1]|uniref:FkbM family methyltransferase n=1 Tax=Taishania pollutisoli TaxID=2766479 RepID=A0A8J6TYA5_9FLAO|nr:FkbM family methyltransferase [Taishania pollutisoli]MBC9813781.1 FkbM family methyltransferase [Taishania pollutisoli]NGF77291.1 FkbM family methyltransferase [Fluviicola sp. SGL-29]